MARKEDPKLSEAQEFEALKGLVEAYWVVISQAQDLDLDQDRTTLTRIEEAFEKVVERFGVKPSVFWEAVREE